MPTAAPLQILLFRHEDDLEVEPYEEHIARAFQGGKEAGGYLATGEDLGIQLEVFSNAPARGVAEALDSFCHTVTLVLADRALIETGDRSLWNWLSDCYGANEGISMLSIKGAIISGT